MRIHAFSSLTPPAALADQVAAVPYDVVNAAEARALAADNPHSFLHVTRPDVDLPDGAGPAEQYARARDELARFVDAGSLVRSDRAAFYIYRQQLDGHAQSGLVACCHIEDYEHATIKKHEHTRPDKEADRAEHIRVLNAQTGPVFLAYRETVAINELVADAERGDPVFDFTAPDGVRHTGWSVPDPQGTVAAFGAVPAAYIADGHHRAASAAKVGAERRGANPAHAGDEDYNWFLAVLFPSSRLKVLAYNRVVQDLNGHSADELLSAAEIAFDIAVGVPPTPDQTGDIRMYLAGKWYGLRPRDVPADDPVAMLDVSILQDQLLAPLLGIDDPRTSTRIEFVGGIRGVDALVDRVDSGTAAVAFSMYPTTVDQLMAVADSGDVMPPKSTWFEPKLRSGLFVHTLGD